MSDNRLIRIKELIKITGLSKSYIYQLAKENHFPKPIRLVEGGIASAWVLSEINSWIDSRIADRK